MNNNEKLKELLSANIDLKLKFPQLIVMMNSQLAAFYD